MLSFLDFPEIIFVLGDPSTLERDVGEPDETTGTSGPTTPHRRLLGVSV